MPSEPREDPLNGFLGTAQSSWALEATTDCVVLLDRAFRIVYVNRHVTGINDVGADLVGRTHWEAWPQTAGTEIEARYRRAMETGRPEEFEHYYSPKGAVPEAWHEIHAYPNAEGLAVFFRDVTPLRRREASAEAQRARMESAIRAADTGVWYCELPLEGTPLSWSPETRRHFGIFDDHPVTIEEFFDRLHPEDREPTRAAIARSIEGHTSFSVVYRTLGDDGQTRTIRAAGGAHYDPDGTPVRFDGFTTDISRHADVERRFGEARAHLDAILATADIASWMLDIPGDTIAGDANFAAMFGLDPGQGPVYPAPAIRARIHPDDVAALGPSLREAALRGERWSVEYRIVRDDGVRWVNARGVPELDAAGHPARLPGVVVDITGLKRAERRQRFRVELVDALRGLGDARDIGIVVCRMAGEFLGADHASYGLVDVEARTVDVASGWSKEGSRRGGLFRYEEFGIGILEELERGLPLAIPDVATHPLTRDRYEDKFAPMGIRSFLTVPLQREGRLEATFSVQAQGPRDWTDEDREILEDAAQRAWDVVERARAEEGLRVLNAALDARVRERTADLQQANEELQSFTSTISHDLRGPLRNIHGLGQMLLQDAGDRLTEDERHLLHRQAHNALRVAQIVEDLLKLARLAREPLHREPFDLTALATSVRDDFIDRSVCGLAAVEVAPGLQAVGDRRLVRFVLLNLLENACKFSPQGGTVRLGQRDGAFFVSDEGVGFDMAHAAKIFQPFERLVSERQFPGTGIGLANVHRIVTRHGGRIWADAKPGEGATFWFTLEPSLETGL